MLSCSVLPFLLIVKRHCDVLLWKGVKYSLLINWLFFLIDSSKWIARGGRIFLITCRVSMAMCRSADKQEPRQQVETEIQLNTGGGESLDDILVGFSLLKCCLLFSKQSSLHVAALTLSHLIWANHTEDRIRALVLRASPSPIHAGWSLHLFPILHALLVITIAWVGCNIPGRSWSDTTAYSMIA